MNRTILPAAAAALALAACGRSEQAAAPAADSRPYLVYATNETSGDLTIIDDATRAVVGTAPLGKRPRGIRLSPDGKSLYVALSGSPLAPPGVDEDTLPPADKAADGIGIFDIASRRLVKVLRGVSDPEQVAIGKDGRVYVASEDTGQLVVLDSGAGNVVAQADVGGEPEGVAISPDGRFVYVTSEEDAQVAVFDTQRNAVVKTIKVGARPRSVAFTSDGTRAFVTGENDQTIKVIDARNHAVANSIKLSGGENILPMDVVVSPDNTRIYVSTGRGGTVVALDAVSLSQLGAAKVGQRPWGIALTPDGKRLYAANGPSNDVSVVDTATMTEVARIPVGQRPWGVVAAPAPAAQ